MEDKFRYYPLPAEGVELMRQYQALEVQMHEDIERLQKEYSERAKATIAVARDQLHEVWVKMAALAGVDAVTSWDNQDWHVEGRYVDNGFAALTFYPAPVNPFATMMGQPPVEDDEESGAPKGATLN